jgi:hypothetical protein
MAPLTWNVDTGRDCVHVDLRGRPDAASLDALRGVLVHHHGRRDALMVDLSEIPVLDQARVIGSAVPSGPGVIAYDSAVLLLADQPHHPAGNSDGLGVRMRRALEQTTQAVAWGPLSSPFFVEQLLPASGAARSSRDTVTGACVAWNRPQRAMVAAQIGSELVSHTIRRVSTLMTFMVLLHQDVLYLTVRGGSRAERVEPDLELTVIHAFADRWGFLSDDDDTIIWAAMNARPAP